MSEELISETEADVDFDGGPTAIALALDGARHDPGLRDAIAGFLDRQGRLLDDQRHHMKLKHFSERLKVTLQLLTLLVGAAAVGSLGVVSWQAHNDHSLVIEGLSVPADLATQGAGGAALSGELQDKLILLEEETASPESAAELREASRPGVKVEIPETGVSIAELSEALTEWLGHETRVSGDVSHVTSGPDAGSLALALRVGATHGVRLVQADGDMEALLQKGAEHIYAATQPLRFTQWLSEHGRTGEAADLARELVRSGPPETRARALEVLGTLTLPEVPAEVSRELFRRAVLIGGDRINYGIVEQSLGHWETAYQLFTANLKQKVTEKLSPNGVESQRLISQTDRDYMLGRDVPIYLCFAYDVDPCGGDDLVTAIATAASEAQVLGSDALSAIRILSAARKLADGHDPEAGLRLLILWRAPDASRSAQFKARMEAERVIARTHVDKALEDWPRVLDDAQTWTVLAAAWPGLRYPDSPHLQQAYALARLGRAPEAEALLAGLPADCYPCLNMRGQVAAIAGRGADAERWFAAAAKQGPSLPLADTNWGAALLARGDIRAALVHLPKAARLGPQDAEALELWGEALLAAGKPTQAAAKFEQAASLAPAWGRLRLKWGEALAKGGRTTQARAQFQAAAARFLSPADKAELKASLV